MKDYKSFVGEGFNLKKGLGRLPPDKLASAKAQMKNDGIEDPTQQSSGKPSTNQKSLPGTAEKKQDGQKSMPVNALAKKDDKGSAMFGKKKQEGEGTGAGTGKGKLHNDKQDVGVSHYVPRAVTPEKKVARRTKKPNISKIAGNLYNKAKEGLKHGQGGKVGTTSGGKMNEPGTRYQ